jgi:hypothetical protein
LIPVKFFHFFNLIRPNFVSVTDNELIRTLESLPSCLFLTFRFFTKINKFAVWHFASSFS